MRISTRSPGEGLYLCWYISYHTGAWYEVQVLRSCGFMTPIFRGNQSLPPAPLPSFPFRSADIVGSSVLTKKLYMNKTQRQKIDWLRAWRSLWLGLTSCSSHPTPSRPFSFFGFAFFWHGSYQHLAGLPPPLAQPAPFLVCCLYICIHPFSPMRSTICLRT